MPSVVTKGAGVGLTVRPVAPRSLLRPREKMREGEEVCGRELRTMRGPVGGG